jgi:hypothetical protein
VLYCQKHNSEVDADRISMCSPLLSRQPCSHVICTPDIGPRAARNWNRDIPGIPNSGIVERGVVPGVVETLGELAKLFTLPSTAGLQRLSGGNQNFENLLPLVPV